MFNLHELYYRLYSPHPRVVCEVGVNGPSKCSLTEFIRHGIRTILVEPLPWHAAELREAFPEARVIEAACTASRQPTVTLFDRGEGSWIDDVPLRCAPDERAGYSNVKRETFKPAYVRQVPAIVFGDIDEGAIDLLCVDVEGAEWFVLRTLRSRPKLIRLETHWISEWTNPFLAEIQYWMKGNNYIELAADVSDTLYALNNHS